MQMAVDSMAGATDAASSQLQEELAAVRAELETLRPQLAAAQEEAALAAGAYEEVAAGKEQVGRPSPCSGHIAGQCI